MENDHLVRSSLDAQIKEAKSRAEQFSKSLQDAREQEAIALRLLEQERERWTHSFEEKSILIEQLERELTSTVEALDVERSTDKFSSNFAHTGNTNATNTIHETNKLNNLPRSSDIREINYNEMNKSMHDIISDVNNYQPNQADVRIMNGTSNHHNYRDQHFQYNPNPAPTLSSTDPLYFHTTNHLASTGYSRQSTHQPQQQAHPTVSHSYHAPPILSTTTTTPSLPTNPPPPAATTAAALTQPEDVTVWRDLLAQYQQQLKTTKTELLTCTEQRDHYSQQNELLNKEVKQLLEEKELFATACENAEGKLKFRVSQIIQYEEEKDALSQRITELTALNSDLQRDQDNMRHELEVTRAELHIVTQRAQIGKHNPDWKYADSIHPDEADKVLKPCVSTATQCSSSDGSEVQHGATATAASARRATQATEAYIKDLHRQLEETHTSYEGQLEEVRHQVTKLQQRVRSAEQQVEQSHQQHISAEEAKERYRVERDALLTMVSKLHLNSSAEHPPYSSERDYRSSHSTGAVSSRSYDHYPQQQQQKYHTQPHDAYTHSGEATTRQQLHQQQQDQEHHAHSTNRSDSNEFRTDHPPEQRIHHDSTAHQSHHAAPSTHLTTVSPLTAPVQETSSIQEHTHSQLRNRTPTQQPSAAAADAQRPGPSTGAPVRGAVTTHSSLPAPSGSLTAAVETQQDLLPRSLLHTAASSHRDASAISHDNNIEYHSEGSSSDSSSNSDSDSEEEESECESDEGSSEEDVAASHQGHRTDTTALATSTSNVLNMSDGPHAEAHNPVQALAARQAHIASMLTSSKPTLATQMTKKSTTKASTTHKKSKKAHPPIRGTPPSSKQPTGTPKSADRSPASMVIRQPPSYTGASNDRFVRGGVEHIHTLKGHKNSTAKNKSLTSKTTGSSNKQTRTAKPSSSSDKLKKASTANKDSIPKAAALDHSPTNVATAAAVNQLYIPASFSNPADISWVSETAVAPTTTAAVGAVPSTTSTGTAPVGWKKEHVPFHHQYEETRRGSYEADENALDAAGLHLSSREHFHPYRQSDADERSESSRSSVEVGEGEEHSEEESEECGDVDSLHEEQEGVYGQLGHDENLLQSAQHLQPRSVQEYRGDDHHFAHPAGLAPHPHVLPDGEDEDSDALNHCMVVQRVPDRKVLGGINFHDLSHAPDHPTTTATATTTVPPHTTATATATTTSQDVYIPSTASVASDISSTHLSADDYQGSRPRHSLFTGVTDIKISRKSQPDVDLTRSASTGGGSARSSAEKLSSKSKPATATAAVLRTGTGRGNSRARTPSPMLRSATATTTSSGRATGSTSVTRGSKHYTPTSYSTRRSSNSSNGHNSGVPVVTPSTSTLRTTGSSSLTGKLLSGKSKGSTNMNSTSTSKAKSNGASRQRTLLF